MTVSLCTFCGRGADAVSKLIEGPGISICDRCVEEFSEALTAGKTLERESEACSFCSFFPLSKRKKKLFGKNDANICECCLDVCLEILEDDLSD